MCSTFILYWSYALLLLFIYILFKQKVSLDLKATTYGYHKKIGGRDLLIGYEKRQLIADAV
jgi:hypothetical protein